MQERYVIFDKFPELTNFIPFMSENDLKLFNKPYSYLDSDIFSIKLEYFNMDFKNKKLIEQELLNLEKKNVKRLINSYAFLDYLKNKILFEGGYLDKRGEGHFKFYEALGIADFFVDTDYSANNQAGRINLLLQVLKNEGNIVIGLKKDKISINNIQEKDIFILCESNINGNFKLSLESMKKLKELIFSTKSVKIAY